jgi:hypothetical protein
LANPFLIQTYFYVDGNHISIGRGYIYKGPGLNWEEHECNQHDRVVKFKTQCLKLDEGKVFCLYKSIKAIRYNKNGRR